MLYNYLDNDIASDELTDLERRNTKKKLAEQQKFDPNDQHTLISPTIRLTLRNERKPPQKIDGEED